MVLNTATVAKRNSNMELLRIIAMLFVMFFHTNVVSFNDTCSLDFEENPFSSFTRVFWYMTTIICVDTFVLLSGWYGIRTNSKKILGLIFQVFFFTFLCYFMSFFYDPQARFSIHSFSLLFLFNKYWFFISYLFLLLFAPIINIYIEKVPEKTFRIFLFFFFILHIFYGYIQDIAWYDKGSSPIFFFLLYMLARYVRLYKPAFSKLNKYIDLSIFIFIILIQSFLYCFLFINKASLDYIVCYLSPLVIIDALFFLLFFSKINFKNRIINWIAISSFAAYLFHFSLWDLYVDTLNDCMINMNTFLFILFYFLYVFSFFIIAIFIDKIRIYFFEKLYNSVYKKVKKDNN